MLSHALAAVLLSPLLVIATPRGYGGASGYGGFGGYGKSSIGKAIYVLGNDAENAVFSYPIKSDGTLGKGSKTPTGGEGSNVATNGNPAMPQTPDALGSQGAVAVAGNYVFAVNAGSNTLSMFEADARDASKLKLISQSAELPGEFPTTVDASDNHKLACVGFTGAKSGVSCLSYSKKGLGRADALRDFNLGQTTPPNSSLALVGSTFFSGDQNYVYTTVRGDKNFAFYSFPVYGYGKASSQGVKSLPNFPRNLFGAESVPGTNKVVSSDTIIGADVLTVGRSQVPAITEVNVAGQKASCWITQSVKTGSGYVTDSKIDRLVEFDLNTGAIIKELNLNTGDAGHNDAAVGGNYLYTLYSGNVTAGIEASVTVVDTNGEKGYMKRVEHYLLDGVTTNSVGLALKM